MKQSAAVIVVAVVLLLAMFISPRTALAQANAQAAQTVERFDRTLERIRQETRLQVSPDVPIDQRTFYDAGGYFTFNYLSLDDATNNNRGFRQYDTTAYGRLVIDGANEFFVRGRLSYRDYNPGDNLNDQSSGLDGMVERAFWRFDLAKYRAAYGGADTPIDFTLKGGRDFIVWANGVVLANVIDGAQIDIGFQPFNITLLAGVTAKQTVDFDSSRPDFDRDTHRGFYGAMLTTRIGNHRPFIYAIMQRDYNHKDTLFTPLDDTGTQGINTKFDYNSHYFGIGSNGSLSDRLTYGLELVYEGGQTLSNSFTQVADTGEIVQTTQTLDSIEAYALDFELDYLVGDQRQTRFAFETILATGDNDRLQTSNTLGGNLPGTKDRAFNAFGLLNTGLAFGPSVSNLWSMRLGASTFPFPDVAAVRRMQVGMDFFVFQKFNANAPIDEETSDSRFLGVEPDVYLNWQITSDVALSVRYGLFIPGDSVENDKKFRQFLYTGVTIAF
ncbi:MAG: alginate export family protein [Anaerolineae bacterium]|nr:alginate export family protein [Phycisphaerae bacterium]